jgi:outer membrane scaffolding protein for murein synthesis (MipA/OmpV family)
LRVAVATLALVGGAAGADATSAFPQWQRSAGVLLDSYSEGAPPEWSFLLGAGAEAPPVYDGSDRRKYQVFPLADVRWRDIAYASVNEGIGVNLARGKDHRAGISLNWDFGRDRGAAGTRGIDRLPSAPVADLYAEQVFFRGLVGRLDVRHLLTRDTGTEVEGGAYAALPFSDSFLVFAGPSVTWADARAMQSRFAVSAADAAASGFPEHSMHAGIKAATVGLNAVWLVDAHWIAEAFGGYSRLFGRAANSPLTHAAASASAGVIIGYAF